MQEEEMIKAILAGGRQQDQALVALYRKGAEWRRYFVHKGLRADKAEDVMQVAVFKVFEQARSYAGKGGFGDSSANAWMWQVAKNCMLDAVRVVELPVADGIDIGDAAALPARDMSADACVAAGIEDFAADFPDRARALEMQMDGEDMQSIANRIGRTVGATKEFLSQCKKKLAPYIEHCLPLLAA